MLKKHKNYSFLNNKNFFCISDIKKVKKILHRQNSRF